MPEDSVKNLRFIPVQVYNSTMPLAKDSDIEDFAEDVRDSFGGRIVDIILFGSYARGDYVPGSDIDLIVVLDKVKKSDREKVADIAGNFFLERDLQFSPKLVSEQEFEESKDKGHSFYQNVAEEGVEI